MNEEQRTWKKSSHSMTGNCVEVSPEPGGGAAVRDSKAGDRGPVLAFTANGWNAFLAGVRDGEFSSLGRPAIRPGSRQGP